MNCSWCEEPVNAAEQDPRHSIPMHLACGYRETFGSVAHIEKRCSCYVSGSVESDPPGMTKREAAYAAFLAGHAEMIERTE